MADELDFLIKSALDSEAQKAPKPDEVFPGIRKSLLSERAKKADNLSYRFFLWNFKKALAAFTCLIVVVTTFTFFFSGSSRAFAIEALNRIKTIFVLDNSNDKLKVVEKPSNQALAAFSVCRTTALGDEELKAKLGYQVKFPETICGDYSLSDKAISVSLGKQLDYDTCQELQGLMLKAVDDDNSLKELSDYNPRRAVFATYRKSDGSMIYISVDSENKLKYMDKMKDESSLKGRYGTTKVEMTGCKAYWVKFPYPEYPLVIDNGVGKSDMSQPPTSISEKYLLTWTKGKLHYTVSAYQSLILSLDESVKIAEEFLRQQPEAQ